MNTYADESNRRWIALDSFPEGSEPSVSVIESHMNHTLIDIEIHGFYIRDILAGNNKYQLINIPGYKNTTDIGAPSVPRIALKIAIPDTRSTKFREITRSTQTFEDMTIYPAQPPQTDNTAINDYTINRQLYNSNNAYPDKPGKISKPRIWRDVRLVVGSLYPVVVDCIDDNISIANHILFEVRFSDGITINTIHRKDFSVSHQYDRMYRSAIVNYDHLNFQSKTHRTQDHNYLMIVDDPLIAAIQPLADLHTHSGNPVSICPVSEVGNTYDAIKAEISSYYQSDQIEYVLLVGELSQIPVHSFDHHGMYGVGDYDYSLLEGDDFYPEIAVGRILSDQPDLTNHICIRILNYITDPPMDNWFERSMLCAHQENYPYKYTECKNQIRDFPYSIQIPVFSTFYPPEGNTHTQVVNAMENGAGIVNYRGHGGPTSWSWSIGWSNSDIYSLNNNNRTPVVWNIACYNGEVDASAECLCEAWQNAGANGSGGAVGSVGATRASFTSPNHTFDKALYQSIFDIGATRLGNVVNYGKISMISDSIYGEYNARIYMLFGDPAMDITTLSPESMDCSYPAIVQSGEVEIEVTVMHEQTPVEEALVCLYKTGDCYETGITDTSGNVIIPITVPFTEGVITLQVTAHNFQIFTTDIPIANGGCGVISFDEDIYGCTQMIEVSVVDADLNTDPFQQEETLVSIVSDTEPYGRTVILTEIGIDEIVFQGTIQASPTQSGPGFILVSHADTVTAAYSDDDCVGAPQIVLTSAVIDCAGPGLSIPEVTDITTDSVSVEWVSDEDADSRLMWGTTIPLQNETYISDYTTIHSINLTGLTSGTEYFFSISSTDIYNNNTTDNNDGLYYSFVTQPNITPTPSTPSTSTPNPYVTATPTSVFTSTPEPHTPNPTTTSIPSTPTPPQSSTNTPCYSPGFTPTPTPPHSPTSTPTMSPPPSPTATYMQSTATPTSLPNATNTPDSTQTSHPTPPVLPTITPSPPPTPYKGMKMYLIDRDLYSGDEFNLYFSLSNPEFESYECNVYLLLNAFGNYWFWPSWIEMSDGLDYEEFQVPARDIMTVKVLKFMWPDDSGEGYGLSFIGAAFRPKRWNMIGEIQTIEWQYH